MLSRLNLPTNRTTLLQRMVAALDRLVGAKIKIEQKTFKEDDLSWRPDNAIKIRFMNRGQSAVIIDEQVIILPGEAYTEGDTAGPGIDHMYNIRFMTAAKNGIPEPDSDIPYVYPGNHLSTRTMIRKSR